VTSDLEHLVSDGDDDEGLDAPATAVRRSPRIGPADVFRAADELLLEGNRPTIDRVRMRLGRGSPNTINEHLDAWWHKLGARLRDIPGREFPQLPERTAQALLTLWNEALEGAQDTLRGSIGAREGEVAAREDALSAAAAELCKRETALAARAAGLEESMALAKEQLLAANQRAERLEAAFAERDAESIRLRSRMDSAEAEIQALRGKHEATLAFTQAERSRLEERHQSAEGRWLTEVDRVRQHAKEQEQQIKDFKREVTHLKSVRDTLREEIQGARADIKTAAAVREQLEMRLRTANAAQVPQRAARKPKKSVSTRTQKPVRPLKPKNA
jgi:predicted  nucleic acid-binding Zn-ribbon protein